MNPQPREANFGLDDLGLMIGSVIPAFLASTLLTRGLKAILPVTFSQRVVEVFFFQTVFYICTLAALYFVVAVRHRLPFLDALAWRSHFPGAGRCVGLGLTLMFATSGLGAILKAPIIPNPWQDLITGKGSQFAVIVFAAVLGPIWEELLFRGFLYRLLERYVNPWLAILAAAIPFGLIHGSQNQWVWQYIVLIAFSGLIFGFVRYRTKSTLAAALTHSAYNTAQFIVFLVQSA